MFSKCRVIFFTNIRIKVFSEQHYAFVLKWYVIFLIMKLLIPLMRVSIRYYKKIFIFYLACELYWLKCPLRCNCKSSSLYFTVVYGSRTIVSLPERSVHWRPCLYEPSPSICIRLSASFSNPLSCSWTFPITPLSTFKPYRSCLFQL